MCIKGTYQESMLITALGSELTLVTQRLRSAIG
jgi:hypothetical protein